MSNSSPPSAQLKISQLSLAGEGAWPDLHVEQLAPQLNVFCGPSGAGKSSLAELIGHLMYGKSDGGWRPSGRTAPTTAGALHLIGCRGNFILRRQVAAKRHEFNRPWRLTISSAQGDTVDSQTIQDMLSGLSPRLAAQLYLVDFAESPRVERLLNETFARDLANAQWPATRESAGRQTSCRAADESRSIDRVDRRRVDQLIKRRDTVACELEQQLSVRRRESEVLQRELSEVDSALTVKRKHAVRLQAQLRSLDTERAGLETRLRYFSLERYAEPDDQQLDPLTGSHERQAELAALDQEITHSRQSLAHCQQREKLLRTDMAQCGPDGTADSVTCLADGRATLGVLEQLLDDLDAEVSQLARGNEPGRCVGHDAHARLSPVAELLRQQVYTLCGQLAEQERSVRRQRLIAELRQLARVHSELGERLDLLLSSRESLIQRSQPAGRSARLVPQAPAADQCRCAHHGQFVQSADAMMLGLRNRGRHESDARSQLSILERQHIELSDEFNTLQREIDQLARRWEDLQRERGGLLGGGSIKQRKAELERLESVLHQSLQATESGPRSTPLSHWRASDILAQLTDGQLVQIGLGRRPAEATITDRQGRSRVLESLSAAERDQLYLALTLALVAAYGQRGVQLPLILDEPFLQQEAAQVAAMVGVLDEFARAGHQLLVFTENQLAQRRFATLSATLFDLEQLRREKSNDVDTPLTSDRSDTTKTAATAAAAASQRTGTRIVRETYDGHTTPVLRLAAVDGDSRQDDVFFLAENSTFGDFPLLGADTCTLLQRVQLHSVADLLAADPAEVARRLDRAGINAAAVRLWQIHMSMMCHVPNLTLDDAQVLAASGIDSPQQLCDADVDTLLRHIASFLRSERGQRFKRCSGRYSRSRLGDWRAGARRYRDRWERSSRRNSGSHSRRSQPPDRASSPAAAQRSRTRKNGRQRRFYLGREQAVEDAPSIGPKTATRLAKVGIRTVADLLQADAESTAAELDVNHISAATVSAWQHQSRLVCQIPELRGYAAQLLVACGLTQPEQIASTPAHKLVAQVLAFCDSKAGQRLMRSGDAPQPARIAEWVKLAAHSRPLEAA